MLPSYSCSVYPLILLCVVAVIWGFLMMCCAQRVFGLVSVDT